ncbi:type II toxin-antitoxin system RelE/ParE family toxin [Acidomonas methanolica]|uniref:type II toxin-antitoxin system RelE/ParE family toxin n=1 Tax=Acidomonas methanolica TaxID=437 RepID=UPI002119FB78|nr:type II toxin-antitoxin system RelE/ParE family toxin [Acidomonas methanolica]MCQ9156673.1 type II toxin-antitoxin system RelE/ParE family toxin [Acidomonas methanolica]
MEVKTTLQFRDWLANLKDSRAAAKIKARLIQIEGGSFGDVKPCGEGVSESRIHYGPGYRLYFVQRGAVLVVILGAGTKRTQSKDIRAAKVIAGVLEDDR